MPTRSEESDLRWDRVEAREAHYRQSSQGNPQPPNAKKRIDSIELGLMGTHFEFVSEDESYPARIDDFTNNEAADPSCGTELKIRRDSIYDQPDPDSSVAKEPVAETRFTPKWGPYLPLSEIIETRRQLSNSKSAERTFEGDE
ncbi:hypothetical protein COCC4DRAFT_31900 [Bipolaris maydis ATCC 48331]|uniref:Uncharacterized protein n=2 Tax=Cochliobolus heterostrophus TaxID=5016 RepID=M2UAW3_COCH5|nr:uncharacterized protein COCC4DRAFT_31900 [Bipolaris maydis ATCC 48331]EMD90826.1 hypothetical protein COCHEDRAFT_1021658 [Bipolaris maydis C5]KAJ5022579.1 hypothetical protein J3E73DRAFT_340414 [Bipolaris maydis]ENI06088.1 hypothetical protein COCC4DRAFT_31900 [Bipolaris maydis ATCC 48331]KAJ6267827.1 hypothetical protein PSV08DRAFT_322122 [Bipolaris maydis]KAJ6277072.1 hypothetical protein J3E71DRAFT_328341 [Bipolaris maydis]